MILISEHPNEDEKIEAAQSALLGAGVQVSVKENSQAYSVITFGLEEVDGISDERTKTLTADQKVAFMEYAKGSLYSGLVQDGFERLGYLFDDWCGETK